MPTTPVGLISKIEYEPQSTATSGILLDLSGPARVARAFVLPATATTPTRLVIDLEPTTAEAYLARAGAAPRGAKAKKVAAVEKTKPRGPRKKVIVLDPGHGGIDPGAIGRSGTYEKFITLAAARDLKKRLQASGRYKVILTRDEDESLALRKRTEIAHAAAADIFISLHADSIADPSVRGLSVYTLSEKASDAEAEALAKHENQADIIIGMDLTNETAEVRNILVDLAQRESRNLATHLASTLIGELQREVRLLPNTHRFAGFAVLKSPDIPSVLIEMGYMSNRADEADLKKDAYRGKLMAAILRGLDQYFSPTVVARQL
jgi:N-acetylmuramoyl-L-alanine amidase